MSMAIEFIDENEPAAAATLVAAIQNGDVDETARRLLEHGADIDWLGWDDLRPLDIARERGDDDLFAWLRDHGATGTQS